MRVYFFGKRRIKILIILLIIFCLFSIGLYNFYFPIVQTVIGEKIFNTFYSHHEDGFVKQLKHHGPHQPAALNKMIRQELLTPKMIAVKESKISAPEEDFVKPNLPKPVAPKVPQKDLGGVKYDLSSIFPLARYPLSPPPMSLKDSVEPGEGGNGVSIEKDDLSPEELKKYEEGEKNNAFNEYASSLISVRRYIRDFREKECQAMSYPGALIPVSVIICFHNEAWTVLLRSVHSVIDRSPAYLIKEIILVDDASVMEHLKGQLERYMLNLGKVRIIRTNGRQGLIRARLEGARAATSSILVFLDSHVECVNGWLEPLVDRIVQNHTNVVVPVIDVISDNTLAFISSAATSIQVGGFDWGLQFHWHVPPTRDKNRAGAPFSPIRSPTMAGGLFAIHTEFFKKLGYYDPGFEVWGGENLELSFKTWMCGGTLEIIPCSHVGHIFRSRSPYSWNVKVNNPLRRNSLRLAHVWLDDYMIYYIIRGGSDNFDYGDISQRKALRKSLQCHSFKWYLDNIYPELFVPSEAIASGEIRNGDNRTCLDAPLPKAGKTETIRTYPCHNQGGNQFWFLGKTGEIRRDSSCADSGFLNGQLVLVECHGSKGNQEFFYDEKNQITHHSKCLESGVNRTAILKTCDGGIAQHWIWNRQPFKPILRKG